MTIRPLLLLQNECHPVVTSKVMCTFKWIQLVSSQTITSNLLSWYWHHSLSYYSKASPFKCDLILTIGCATKLCFTGSEKWLPISINPCLELSILGNCNGATICLFSWRHNKTRASTWDDPTLSGSEWHNPIWKYLLPVMSYKSLQSC